MISAVILGGEDGTTGQDIVATVLLHDGSAASLAEMFDAGRLKTEHVPGGWKGPGVTKRSSLRTGHSEGDFARADIPYISAALTTNWLPTIRSETEAPHPKVRRYLSNER